MKDKIVPINSELQDDLAELAAIEQIKESLDLIERKIPVYTPDLQWFEQKVKEEQRRLKKRLQRDLLMFWAIALLVVSGVIISIYKLPAVFIFLQVLAMASLPFAVIKSRRQREMLHDES